MKFRDLFRSPTIREAFAACRQHFLAAAGASFLLNLLFLAPAIYMLQVYDRVVATGGKLTLLYITVALAIALVTLTLLDALRNRILLRAGARINNILAPQVLRRMNSTERPSVGAEAVRDLDNVRQVVGSPVMAAIFDAPWTPVFIIVSFMLHVWLGVFATVSTAVLIALAIRNERTTRPLTDRAGRALSAFYAIQQGVAIRGGTVRALGMGEALVARQLAERSGALASLLAAQFTGGKYSAAIRFFRLFAQSAALGIGALLAIDGQISAGAIIAASILLGRGLQPVETIVSGWSNFSSALTSAEKLSEQFPEAPHREEIRTALPTPKGLIEVEKVVVSSPDESRPILTGVTLRAEPGQILGIVGPSGSGKSTLARVIAGAVAPDLGVVRIDGAPYDAWEAAKLGRHIGYMPQEPSLLDGTVKENISRFARWIGADPVEVDERTIAAAKAAQVHELIMRLPSGYETRLSGPGIGLSAGQAQRIALARALYGDPAVLMLDEPNAFMDTEGEAAVLQALEDARTRGASVIVIAHRMAILQSADVLLVMANGRPQLAGPRQEVLARLAPPKAAEAIT
jgi:PrtD family type I secretion system ABC transporter